MTTAVTYSRLGVVTSEQIVAFTRAKARVASPSSNFCTVGTTEIWFPVAPGTTTLPAPPAGSTNANPRPPDSVQVPPDFDDSNLCYIFQDLLPVNNPPVYAVELEPAAIIEPYIETIPLLGVTRTSISIREYPYELTLPTEILALVTRAVISIPTYIANIDAGAFVFIGKAASVLYNRKLQGAVGSFALDGFGSGFVRDYVIGTNAGTFNVNGAGSGLAYQRLPLASEVGTFAIAGQDSGAFYGKTLISAVGSFAVTGEAAGLSQPARALNGVAGSFTFSGLSAGLGFSDPYFSSVSLLLNMDGADNGTSFADSSSNSFAIVRSGNVVTKTDTFKYGNASALFDGSGDALSVSDNDAWSFGSGDFTIETWIYFTTTTTTQTIISQGAGTAQESFGLLVTSTSLASQFTSDSDGQTTFNRTWTRSPSTWYHIALTRSATTLRWFVDGTQVGSNGTLSAGFTLRNSNQKLYIGALNTSTTGETLTTGFSGNLDEIRITKGFPRYTANFTAPGGPFPTF